MKTLKLITICLLFLYTQYEVKAQHLEFTQGVAYSFFHAGGTKSSNIQFETTNAMSYSIGLHYWLHPNNLKPLMLSAHLLHQRGSVAYHFKDQGQEFDTSVEFNTQYLVIGLQPYTFKGPNQRLELAFAIELAILIQNQSTGFDNYAPSPISSIVYSFRNVRTPNKSVGSLINFNIGYTFNLGQSCLFIPRLTLRLADLKDRSVVDDERSVGLEFGFRF